MSEIEEMFKVFRPIEDSFRELVEDAIESKDHHMLWAMNEVIEGRKP